MLTFLLMLLENDNDKNLLEAVYKEYADWLNYVASSGLFNRSNTDDCIHETFVELIKSFDSFKIIPLDKRKAYIARICNRVIYRINNENTNTLSYEEATDNNYSDGSEYDFSDFDRTDMALIIKDLDILYREPLMMKYGSGLSADEISKALGISTNLVYQRIHRGKNILYDMLTKE